MGKSTINDHFNSYVKLPEGIVKGMELSQQVCKLVLQYWNSVAN